jgi:hypothetical protein
MLAQVQGRFNLGARALPSAIDRAVVVEKFRYEINTLRASRQSARPADRHNDCSPEGASPT